MSRLSSIFIPSCLSSLSEKCFYRCLLLRTVTFESGSRLSYIGRSAFADCSSLSLICIPSSVTELRGWCFACCNSLRMVTFEAGSHVSTIGTCAFSGCSSLASICIPASVSFMVSTCFHRCERLSMVVVAPRSRLPRAPRDRFGRPLLFGSDGIPGLIDAAIHRYRALVNLTVTEDAGDLFLAALSCALNCVHPLVESAIRRDNALANLAGRDENGDRFGEMGGGDAGDSVRVGAWEGE
jgi:hypothetical protein